MSIPSFFVVFFITWLILFFIFLPIGLKIPSNHQIGHANSSPAKSYLSIKLLLSLFFSFILSLIYYFLMEYYFYNG